MRAVIRTEYGPDVLMLADVPPASADTLHGLAVEPLLAAARDLDIAGRSRMDRDDLIGTIRPAGWVAD
ncbi:MAG TPA: hypothetical protein VFZ70_01760 [Euzebyales bacterium]